LLIIQIYKFLNKLKRSLDLQKIRFLNHLTKYDKSTTFSGKDVATFASGAGVALIGKIAGRGLVALVEIILARLLGPVSFGLYAIGWTIVRIAGTIGMMGLHNGVIHFGSQYWRTSPSELRPLLRYTLGFAILMGMIEGGLLYWSAPWLANQLFQKPDLAPVLKGFAFAFPLAISLWVSAAATRISQRLKYSVLGEDFTQPVVNLVLVVVLFLAGLKLGGAVVASVVSFGAGLVVTLHFLKTLIPDDPGSAPKSKFVAKDLLLYSLPTGLAGTFSLLTSWAGRLFIGFYRPAAEAGIFQSASQVSIVFVLILTAMNSIFAPMIADLYYRKEINRINDLYKISAKWGLYLILPIFVVICLLPRELMVTVFGEEYASGALALVILAATQVVNVGTGAVGFLLIMTGNQNNWFIISAFSVVINILLNIMMVPEWGLTGASIATGVSISILYLVGLIEVRRVLKLWPYDRRYLKGLFASVLAAVIVILFRGLVSHLSESTMAVTALLVSGTTFASVLLMVGFDDEDREFIGIIWRRLSREENPG
jgi:O-antigen/teichoic acid export membrane protein